MTEAELTIKMARHTKMVCDLVTNAMLTPAMTPDSSPANVTRMKAGDVIFVARAGSTETSRPCRVCNGDRKVTLILGTGERASLDCDYCSHGYEAPTGSETFYEFRPEPKPYVINAVEVVETSQGELVRYRVGADNAYSTFDASDCFPSAEAAAARCAELVAEAEVEQERQMRAKENGKKSYAWHVGYHLREAKRSREQAAHHERKAALMKEQVRDVR